MATLSLKHIYKTYSDNENVINDFNLEIADQDFVVLVGPSGCGKSSVLRMIAGLEDISKGEIYIGERLVNAIAPKERDIAMVFQNYALYPHMSVYDNMAFGLKMRKVPQKQIDEKVQQAANILNISHLLDRRPKALSGGQKQRVALGRAIVREPKVFLMDEPLSNLDAKLRTQMRSEIIRLHKKLRTTFIYVTHDQVEAMTMGTKIVVMDEGIIQQIDSPASIYHKPANVFVAGFMGTPQMNFLRGSVIAKDQEVLIDFGESCITLSSDIGKLIKQAGYGGKTIIIGIRPEDIQLSQTYISQHSKAAFEAEVQFTELMGAESLIYLAKNKESITVRINGVSHAKIGDIIKFALDETKIHFFDPDSERNIFK
ncbi:multiple sugar transport system ATP-binding protein [Sporomusaceae bacterium BoRhaA]|uniref:ABC transporter ATP-binding protein n=1 Tax=Pelorhabdus rhamnosifermentans TaxID=2772457 RepID=UPI001C05F4DB|nr:sn-glycerol-3-phosphate ABC transporter ATP-binding protein UgpC [Pelorhabdus rhamnosifermentans]MBU2700003.1 multiple sugar transport system ATP-binding protein [Pelorhabdus rhamnosifermentans]